MSKKNILNLSIPWAIRHETFEKLKAFNLNSDIIFQTKEKNKAIQTYRSSGGVAIIRVNGVISRADDWWSWMIGGSSVDYITTQIEEAINDNAIDAILLDVNSPGGTVDGLFELTDTIFSYRGIKPIISYVSNEACSAAYAIAAASSKIIAHETAYTGSIGVIASFGFYKDEDYEEINIVSGISPDKILDIGSDNGKQEVQKQVDDLAAIFVNKMSLYRGQSKEDIINNYGHGGIKISREALASGMIDVIGNFKSALAATTSQASPIKNKITGENKTMKKISFKVSGKQAALVVVDDEIDDVSGLETVETLDAAFLKANMPELVEELQSEGADEETDRQADITDVEESADGASTESMQKIFRDARADRKMNGGDVSKLILKAQRAFRETSLANREKDGANIETGNADPKDPQKGDDAVTAIKKAKERRSK